MVDLSLFKPQSEAVVDVFRRRLKLDRKKVVLFVGRIVPYKGLEYLIKALKYMQDVDPDFHLIVVGQPEGKGISGKSDYYRKVCDEVKNLGLMHKVHFLGKVSTEELMSYYTLADVLVLPSVMRGEAFGTVLLEALACGTPVVASRIPGVKDVLKGNDVVGCYVPPRDEEALGRAIVKIAYNKGAVSEKCREFVKENYSVEKTVEKYVELYQSLK
jgi:rhamnosyl/mannosyltransferase